MIPALLLFSSNLFALIIPSSNAKLTTWPPLEEFHGFSSHVARSQPIVFTHQKPGGHVANQRAQQGHVTNTRVQNSHVINSRVQEADRSSNFAPGVSFEPRRAEITHELVKTQPVGGNSVSTGLTVTSPEQSKAFEFTKIVTSLLGPSFFDQSGGCLAKLGSSENPVSLIVTGVLQKTISGTLTSCHKLAPQRQVQTWVDLIPQLFQPQQAGGNKLNFGSLLFGALDRSCTIEANKEFCRVFQAEFESPNCNLCRLIALAFKPAQIKSCACSLVRRIGPGQNNVLQGINACVGTVATSGILKDKFGAGGWIPVPGC